MNDLCALPEIPWARARARDLHWQVARLGRPGPLTLPQQGVFRDCTPCRVRGTMAFLSSWLACRACSTVVQDAVPGSDPLPPRKAPQRGSAFWGAPKFA